MFVFYLLPAVTMLAVTTKMVGFTFALAWTVPLVWAYVLGHRNGINFVLKKIGERFR